VDDDSDEDVIFDYNNFEELEKTCDSGHQCGKNCHLVINHINERNMFYFSSK